MTRSGLRDRHVADRDGALRRSPAAAWRGSAAGLAGLAGPLPAAGRLGGLGAAPCFFAGCVVLRAAALSVAVRRRRPQACGGAANGCSGRRLGVLDHHLVGRLVETQALERRVPDHAVAVPRQVLDLGDQLAADPDARRATARPRGASTNGRLVAARARRAGRAARASSCRPSRCRRGRRSAAGRRPPRGSPAAARRPRPCGVGALREAADHELLAVQALHLEPVAAAARTGRARRGASRWSPRARTSRPGAKNSSPLPFDVLDVAHAVAPARSPASSRCRSSLRRVQRRAREVVAVEVEQVEDEVDDASFRIGPALQGAGQLEEAGASVVLHVHDLAVEHRLVRRDALAPSSSSVGKWLVQSAPRRVYSCASPSLPGGISTR